MMTGLIQTTMTTAVPVRRVAFLSTRVANKAFSTTTAPLPLSVAALHSRCPQSRPTIKANLDLVLPTSFTSGITIVTAALQALLQLDLALSFAAQVFDEPLQPLHNTSHIPTTTYQVKDRITAMGCVITSAQYVIELISTACLIVKVIMAVLPVLVFPTCQSNHQRRASPFATGSTFTARVRKV